MAAHHTQPSARLKQILEETDSALSKEQHNTNRFHQVLATSTTPSRYSPSIKQSHLDNSTPKSKTTVSSRYDDSNDDNRFQKGQLTDREHQVQVTYNYLYIQ
jgi:hypothetical protein